MQQSIKNGRFGKEGEEIILQGSGKKGVAAEPYRVNWI